jgi:hypothetical protein
MPRSSAGPASRTDLAALRVSASSSWSEQGPQRCGPSAITVAKPQPQKVRACPVLDRSHRPAGVMSISCTTTASLHPLAASLGRGPLRLGLLVRRGQPSTRSRLSVSLGIRRHNASLKRRCGPGFCRSSAAFVHHGGPRHAMRKPGCFTGSCSANSTQPTEARNHISVRNL